MMNTERFGVGDVVRSEDGAHVGVVYAVSNGRVMVSTPAGIVERRVGKWERVLGILEWAAQKEGA